MTHPNAERLRRFLDAYARTDREEIARLLTGDAVWHVGGTHPLSGDYRGRQAILDYFDGVQRETAGTLTLQPIEIMASGQRGAAFLRVTGTRAGRSLDVVMAEAFVFTPDGLIGEFWAHASDQTAIDAFWQ
jgi:ketosteroid isomerase-like protein